ncbi:MAG: ADP-ribosylglycohydrolase family protein [Pirellulaceae bacterium]|nr:ADP-ribosylglycohydrolase family protein [Pirellulaceae bacterium]
MNVGSRYRGSLLGMACGDAVGTTVEFSPPGSFEPVTDMVGGGPFRLRPGQWTDDTSMALCLADSLLAKRGFDPVDQLERYCRWWREGYRSVNGRCFDIGGTVSGALSRFLKSREPYCGSTDSRSAGNGSLMRLAPVPLYFARDPAAAIERAGESSRTTHGAITCIDACRYFAGLIVGALAGRTKDELLAPRFAPLPGYWSQHPLCPEIDAIAAGSFKVRQPPEIAGTGFVVRSLEAALWALHHGRDFESGCLLAVNLGDDADTTAAIFGQLAGAIYGDVGIPDRWRQRLAQAREIEQLADDLLAAAEK